MAVTVTPSEPAKARRWVRPIRPAPISPSRNDGGMSEPSLRKKGTVVPLFLGRPREPLRAAGQDVLLHHQPAAERDAPQAVQDGVHVEVAVAELAERLAGPDVGRGPAVGDDPGHDGAHAILQVHVVDAVAPVPEHGDRVTAAHHHVPGLQAEPDVGPVEHLADLPRGLHIRAGLRVEGGLIAAVAAAAYHPGQALGEPAPSAGVEAEGGLPGGPAGLAAALRAA